LATYEYELQFLDTNGYQTSKRYVSQDLADYAAARAAADALLADVQNLTDAQVTRDRLTEVTFIAGAPAATSNVYERIDATLNLATEGKRANHKFPSPVAGAFSGNALDILATVWTDYEANFQATGDWTVSDGEVLDASDPTLKGKRVFTRGG